MKRFVYVFDPTVNDKLSQVRGVGRYLQILRENFSKEFVFFSKIEHLKFNENCKLKIENSVFVNPFFNFLQPPLTFRRLAKKQVAVIHDLIPLKYPDHFPAGVKGNINIFLNKLTLKNYDTIVTDSHASKKDIVQILKVDENKVKVIYPCLPKAFIEAGKWKIGVEAGQENRSKRLEKNPSSTFQHLNSFPNPPSNFCLYVGDATWNKNLVKLARAIKIINVTCVFVGKVFQPLVKPSRLDNLVDDRTSKVDGWQKEFKQFLEETRNDKRFIFAGFIPDNRLIKLYQQAKLNILVSRDEGFGFSYLEACFQGCPSVLSDIPVLHEISADHAWFADPNDPHDIANKIGEIYFNQKLRTELGFKAQQRAKYFSQQRFKTDFLNNITI